MKDIINILPENVANQIAAGEVVQRPASVIKELLENSIDAKSSEIKVLVKDAGKTTIQIIDNGIGMSKSGPSTLAKVEINATIGSTIVRTNIEKRVAVLGIAFRENTEIILTFTHDVHPHGDGVRSMLVSRQVVICLVNT